MRGHGTFRVLPAFCGWGAIALLALLGALLSAPVPAGAAADADRLTLQSREVPGLVFAARRLPAARRALARLVAPRTARRARVEASAFRAGTGADAVRLRLEVFALPRARDARRALAAWRGAQRRGRARPRQLQRVGDDALLVERATRGGRLALVALRVRRTVAVIRYQAPFEPAVTRRLAATYARLQAARLRRSLGRTAWERVLDARRAGGALSARTALQLFSLLHGSLPGVRLPAGSRAVPPVSGTIILDALIRHRAALTPAQRRAIQAVLWPARRRSARRAGRARAAQVAGCHERVGGLTLDAGYRKLAEELRDGMLSRIRNPEPTGEWPYCVYTGSNSSGYATSWSWTSDWKTPPGRFVFPLHPNQCFIALHPSFFDLTETNRRTILGHEVYHCLHKEWAATYGGDLNPPWAEEGLATWTGNQVAPGTYDPDRSPPGFYYKNWLERTERRTLFEYQYTTFGLFGLIEQEGGAGNLWNAIVPIWRAGSSNAVVFDLATGSSQPEVLDTWGPGLFRQDGWPTGWNQRLPWSRPLAEGSPEVDALLLARPGKSIERSSRPYAADKYAIDGPAHTITYVSVFGHGRVTDGRTEWRHPGRLVLCLGGGCKCPSGQREKRPIPKHTDVTGPLYAGIAGAARSTRLVLDADSLDEYCEPEDRRPPDLPGGGRAPRGPGAPGGSSNGDPHLRTFDGVRYDFQAAGEFILARSTQGGFEVQARQEPWQTSKVVSINTQLAFRVGASRVTVTAGERMVWRVGGRAMDPARGSVRLAGGGSIAVASPLDTCAGTVIAWHDGSRACVWSVGRWGVALSLAPAERRRSSLVGLLGDFDGNPTDDARGRDGTRFEPRSVFGASSTGFRQLYRAFGDSWRVTARESLLDYANGERTATFTRRDFPARFYTVGDLSATARARAEATCREHGVSEPDALEDCILDVAVTGERAFAESAAIAENAVTPTAWTTLAGFEHVLRGPLAVLSTPDGALHVAAGVQPQRDDVGTGHYASTTIDPSGAQRPVATSAPTVPVSRPTLIADGNQPRLLAYVDRWVDERPAGTSDRGVMAWEASGAGRVADWAPGLGFEVTAAVRTADGTPYTLVVGWGGGNASVVRGSGAGATAHPIPAGESCYTTNVNLATDGTSVWAAWLEWDCADRERYGWFVAPVSTASGEIGPSAHAPIPAGATPPLYDALDDPAAFVAGPRTGGAWLAYTLELRGRRHAFLVRAGDATATDLGPIPSTDPMLQLAATPRGALWLGYYDSTRTGRTLIRFRRVNPRAPTVASGTWTLTLPQTETDSLARGRVRLATRGERLDVVAWQPAHEAASSTVWHTAITP